MAAPTNTAFSAGLAQPIHGGRWAGGRLASVLQMAGYLAAGGLAQNLSSLEGAPAVDAVLPGGVFGGYSPPTWLASAPVGEWSQISGTAAPGVVGQYCGIAWRSDDTGVHCYIAAAGGHGGNYFDNSVKTLRFDVDAPAWATLKTAGDSTGYDYSAGTTGAYFPADDSPGPRHLYPDIIYVPELDRVVIGGRFWFQNSGEYLVQDGFRLADNEWDVPGTFADRPNQGPYLEVRDPATGVFYSLTGYKWTPAATPGACAYSAFTLSGAPSNGAMGSAFDTTRDFIFHLCAGNNFSGGTDISSCRISKATGVKTAIGFNASAAWAEFQAQAAASEFLGSALSYDAQRDCYFFYNGQTGKTKQVFVITPNGTDTWDMELLSPSSGVTPATSLGGGVMTKFRYSPEFDALLLVVGGQDVYVMRLS